MNTCLVFRSGGQPALAFAWLLALPVCAGGGESSEPPTASTDGITEETTADTTANGEPHDLEVQFPSAGLSLEGTLSIPAGKQPAPAVVLVHGSGPQSRDQTVPGQLNMQFGFDLPVFAELSQALVERGYVVLRYDKRSCGRFNKACDNDYPLPGDDLLIGTFIDDAHAAVEFVRQRPEVDPNLVFVLGHSQGATFVPALVTRDPQIRGGILVAGNRSPIDTVLANQITFTRNMLREVGVPDDVIDQQLATYQVVVDALGALRAGTHDGAAIGGASAAFWQSWFELNERAPVEAAALDRPLFVLRGEYDWNVDHGEWAAWQATLQSSPHAAVHRHVELPCVTHALNCVAQPDWKAIKPEDIGRNVHPSVIDAVAGFLNDHVTRK